MAATRQRALDFVAGYLIYFAIAFRAKASDPPDTIGVQIHDNQKLEFWWTVIPTLFVIVLSIVSVDIWYKIQFEPRRTASSSKSIGHSSTSTYRYPGFNGEVDRRDASPGRRAGDAESRQPT